MSILYKQYAQFLKNQLVNKGVNLSQIHDDDLPIYFNEYTIRTFKPHKYNVYISKELLQNQKYNLYEEVIESIKIKAMSGG